MHCCKRFLKLYSQTRRTFVLKRKPLLVFFLLGILVTCGTGQTSAESPWIVPNQVPSPPSASPQAESPQPLPVNPVPPAQQGTLGESKASGKEQTPSNLRAALDTRIKKALQRVCPSDARPVGLLTIAERNSSAAARQKGVLVFWEVARVAMAIDFLTECLSELEKTQVALGDQMALEAVKQLYTARIYELRGRLQASMASLLEAVGSDRDRQPVFPDDIPHTGGYRTQLEKLFPETPPLGLRRLNEMIPLARQSIYLHFQASQSAYDAWLACKEAYDAQRGDLWSALACWRLWVDEQLHCAEAIENYNRLILEYVITSGNGQLSAEDFVNMLVEQDARRVVSGQRTSANRSNQTPSSSASEATQRAGHPQTRQFLSFFHHEINDAFEPFVPLGEESPFLLISSTSRKTWPLIPVSLSNENDPSVEAGLSTPYFGKLQQGSAGVFVRQVAELSFKRGMTAAMQDGLNTGIPMDEKLLSEGDFAHQARRYWDIAAIQAKYYVFLQYSALLSELFPTVLARWNEPGAAEEMLQLQAFRRTVDAGLQDIHLKMLDRGSDLIALNSKSDNAHPVAITLPYVGEYDTRWDQIRTVLPEPTRTAAMRVVSRIPATYAALCQNALALNAADQARVFAVGRFLNKQERIGPVLSALHFEHEAWLGFIELTGQYNQLIAEYVSLVRPDLDQKSFLSAIGITQR